MNVDENFLFQRLLTRVRQAISQAPAQAASVAWSAVTGKPDFSAVAASGKWTDLIGRPSLFSGSYADLSGKPALFDGTWDSLANKPVAFATTWALVGGKPALFSGSYGDLTSKPNLFSGAYADLIGKPSLFSGAYADLTGKPALFSGVYADLTGKPVLFSGSYNDLTNKPQLPRAIRAQTNAAGLYVWTFAVPFTDGTVPVIDVTVEDNTMGTMFGIKIVSMDNKSATIQVSKSVAVTVAGISVLGASVAAQAWIHATATAP